MTQPAEASPNPLFETWTTPFEAPPFDRLAPEHFRPAFDRAVAEQKAEYLTGANLGKLNKKERQSLIQRLEAEMKEAAKNLQFERAAELRDALLELKADS